MARFKLRFLVLLKFLAQSLPVGCVDYPGHSPRCACPSCTQPACADQRRRPLLGEWAQEGLEQVPGPVLRSTGRAGARQAHLGALWTPCPVDVCGWRRCEQGPLSMMRRAWAQPGLRAGDGDGGADGAGGSLGPQSRGLALRGEIQGWDVPTFHLKRCSFVTCVS